MTAYEEKTELPDEIKKQLARYEELLQYDNATVSMIDAHRNSLPNRQLINNSSYDTNTINHVYMNSTTTNHDSVKWGGARLHTYESEVADNA